VHYLSEIWRLALLNPLFTRNGFLNVYKSDRGLNSRPEPLFQRGVRSLVKKTLEKMSVMISIVYVFFGSNVSRLSSLVKSSRSLQTVIRSLFIGSVHSTLMSPDGVYLKGCNIQARIIQGPGIANYILG
jgi:hypothetical protein